MEMKILIHHIAPYSILDTATNTRKEGVTISYLSPQCYENGSSDTKRVGYVSCSESFGIDMLHKFSNGIGWYTEKFTFQTRKINGKSMPVPKMNDIEFIERFELQEV